MGNVPNITDLGNSTMPSRQLPFSLNRWKALVLVAVSLALLALPERMRARIERPVLIFMLDFGLDAVASLAGFLAMLVLAALVALIFIGLAS
jgi:hypothetical protein